MFSGPKIAVICGGFLWVDDTYIHLINNIAILLICLISPCAVDYFYCAIICKIWYKNMMKYTTVLTYVHVVDVEESKRRAVPYKRHLS